MNKRKLFAVLPLLALLASCQSAASSAVSASSAAASSSPSSMAPSSEVSSASVSSLPAASSSSAVSSSAEDYGTVEIPLKHVLVGYTRPIVPTFSDPTKAETLTYESQDLGILEISEAGVMKGNKAGTTTVVASSAHFHTTFSVVVDADTRFGGTVSALESGYTKAAYPEAGRTLFLGDSFFDTGSFWTDFYSKYYGSYNAYSMGISATTASEWYYYAQRLIVPFAPENIVMHIGTNDINDDKCRGSEAYQRLEVLFDELHTSLPNTHIYYFGIEPSVAFAANYESAKISNTSSKAYAAKNSTYFMYLDSPSEFEKEDGTADSTLLRSDGLHPLLTTYSIYVNLLKDVLTMTSIEKPDAKIPWQALNSSDSSYLTVASDGTSLTMDGTKAKACTADRAFYCKKEATAYVGNVLITGNFKATSHNSANYFGEIYAGPSQTAWSDGSCFQLVYFFDGTNGTADDWQSGNSGVVIEQGVSDNFDFKLANLNGVVYFQYKDKSWIKKTLTKDLMYSFSSEGIGVSVTGITVSTDDTVISAAVAGA